MNDQIVLKQQLFQHAGDPWEGDSVTLRADLIRAGQRWGELTQKPDYHDTSNTNNNPLGFYTPGEIDKCLTLNAEQRQSDEDMAKSRNYLGVSVDGWVPKERYDTAKELSERFKDQAVMLADSEEDVAQIRRHWPFDYRDEDE